MGGEFMGVRGVPCTSLRALSRGEGFVGEIPQLAS